MTRRAFCFWKFVVHRFLADWLRTVIREDVKNTPSPSPPSPKTWIVPKAHMKCSCDVSKQYVDTWWAQAADTQKMEMKVVRKDNLSVEGPKLTFRNTWAHRTPTFVSMPPGTESNMQTWNFDPIPSESRNWPDEELQGQAAYAKNWRIQVWCSAVTDASFHCQRVHQKAYQEEAISRWSSRSSNCLYWYYTIGKGSIQRHHQKSRD